MRTRPTIIGDFFDSVENTVCPECGKKGCLSVMLQENGGVFIACSNTKKVLYKDSEKSMESRVLTFNGIPVAKILKRWLESEKTKLEFSEAIDLWRLNKEIGEILTGKEPKKCSCGSNGCCGGGHDE